MSHSTKNLRLQHLDVGFAIAVEAYSLADPFHRDPADRIVVATARSYQATLLTADELEFEAGQRTHRYAKQSREISLEVFEKSHARTIPFSIRRIAARSIIISEVVNGKPELTHFQEDKIGMEQGTSTSQLHL